MSKEELHSVVQCWATMLEMCQAPQPDTSFEGLDDEVRASHSPGLTKVPNTPSTTSDFKQSLPPYSTNKDSTNGSASVHGRENGRSPSDSRFRYGSQMGRSMYQQLKSRASTSGTENVRKELPIIINGITCNARHDTCAGGNFMSRERASGLQLDIDQEQEDKGTFMMGNGAVVESIGRVEAFCTFARDLSTSVTCSFHVFDKLTTPLILGYPFLEESKTLSMNRHRLQERSSDQNTYPIVNCIDSSNEKALRFRCQVDSRKTIASADSASDLDLMSSAYAEMYKYKLMGGRRRVQLADTSIVWTTGQVLVTLETADGRSFLKFLDVLPGLGSDILLGEITLESIEAFTRLKDSFVEIPTNMEKPELNILIDLGFINRILTQHRKRTRGSLPHNDAPSLAKQNNDKLYAKLLQQDASTSETGNVGEGNPSSEVFELEGCQAMSPD